jgi:molecular chaperone DnaK
MVKDAEAHAEEDRTRKEEAEIRNTADTLVYQTDKLLKDQADNVTDDEKSTIEGKLADLKTGLEGTDLEVIKDATDGLMSASQEFGQRLYEAAAAEEREAEAEAGTPDDDEVVDAEIIEDDADSEES